jgi:hypothetical protein
MASKSNQKAESNQKTGRQKQHDDVQGGGGGQAGGGGQTKHAEGTQAETSKNERTGSRTHDQSRETS